MGLKKGEEIQENGSYEFDLEWAGFRMKIALKNESLDYVLPN